MFKNFYLILMVLVLSKYAMSKTSLIQASVGNNIATIEYELDDFEINTIKENGETFSTINLESVTSKLLEKGKPALPVDAVSIDLGDWIDIKIIIDSITYKTIKVLPPFPSKGNITRNINPTSIKPLKDDIYKSDIWYPSSNVIASNQYLIRDLSGVAVQIYPFQYNGMKEELRIAEKIVFSIIGTQKGRIRNNKDHNSKTFNNIFKNNFINYNSRANGVTDGDKMIVITPLKYKEAVSDFIKWKNQKGFNTTVHIYPDETGTDGKQIKNFLKDKYTNEKISYVMIIGDDQDVPSYRYWVPDFLRYGEPYDSIVPADPHLVMVSGDDDYADLIIGRITADNEEEVKTVLNKTIKYEKYPDPNGKWYEKTIAAASNEGSPIKDMEWMKDSVIPELKSYGYNVLGEIYQGEGKTVSELSGYLNEGASLFNFNAHGEFDGFGFYENWKPADFWFTSEHVKKLTNGDKLPIVIPLACNIGQYAHREGVAEHWIEHPNGGAIAILASTPIMDWHPCQRALVEINRLITKEAYNTFGAYFYNGEVKMIDEHTAFARKTANTWVYLGDPTLQIFSKTPTKMDFSYEFKNTNKISVKGESGALVTICDPSMKIIESKELTLSSVDFAIEYSNYENITITATKRNRVPFFETKIIGDVSVKENINAKKNLNVLNFTKNNFEIYAPQKGSYTIKIFNMNGKCINKQEFMLSEGKHIIPFNKKYISNGVGLLKVSSVNNSMVKKIIIK